MWFMWLCSIIFMWHNHIHKSLHVLKSLQRVELHSFDSNVECWVCILQMLHLLQHFPTFARHDNTMIQTANRILVYCRMSTYNTIDKFSCGVFSNKKYGPPSLFKQEIWASKFFQTKNTGLQVSQTRTMGLQIFSN